MKFRPTLGADYSGKLGGAVASRNTYGSYFRRLTKPVNPRSPGMVAQRAAFGAVTQAWRGLSKTQQALWIAAAPTLPQLTKKGGTQVLTGQALFMALNVLPLKAGAPLITTPPASATIAGLTAPTTTVNGSGLVTVTYALDPWNIADGVVGASISPPITNGRNFVGQYNTLGTSVFPGATTQQYPAAFQIPVGGLVNVRYRAETPDGRRSQDVTVPATVVGATLSAAAHGAAGAATITPNGDIYARAGQVVARDQTSNVNLTCKTTGVYTIAAPMTVNEAITAADVIGPVNSYPGFTPGSATVIAV
jgi:hypothetical protein